ncbi:MAG: hypothetical protein LBD79_02310 [Treponema sp.]|jgi:hypothetical protein|nr:hypothetical protein [Treponema sp.]
MAEFQARIINDITQIHARQIGKHNQETQMDSTPDTDNSPRTPAYRRDVYILPNDE